MRRTGLALKAPLTRRYSTARLKRPAVCGTLASHGNLPCRKGERTRTGRDMETSPCLCPWSQNETFFFVWTLLAFLSLPFPCSISICLRSLDDAYECFFALLLLSFFTVRPSDHIHSLSCSTSGCCRIHVCSGKHLTAYA